MAIPYRGSERYTIEDYFSWSDEERVELIDGEVHAMTLAPSSRHQAIARRLTKHLLKALDESGRGTDVGGSCALFFGPIDVILAPDTVVQPDLIVVCDPGKITPRAIEGAPDLVVEILSPSTALRDRRTKRILYERARVPEYLLLDPVERYAELFRLEPDGRYGAPVILGLEDSLDLLGMGISTPIGALLPPD